MGPTASPNRELRFECLEPRQLLAADLVLPGSGIALPRPPIWTSSAVEIAAAPAAEHRLTENRIAGEPMTEFPGRPPIDPGARFFQEVVRYATGHQAHSAHTTGAWRLQQDIDGDGRPESVVYANGLWVADCNRDGHLEIHDLQQSERLLTPDCEPMLTARADSLLIA